MANLNELRNALRSQPATILRDCMIAILDDVITLSARTTAHRNLLVEMPKRYTDEINDLRSQFAGLQRLVESLVNERGDGRPAVPTVEGVAPRDMAKIAAEHWQGEAQAQFRAAQQLRAEVEQLTRERDEALREGNYALQCTDERVEAAQMRMVEAIAQYLEQRVQTIVAGYAGERVPHGVACRAAGLTDAVDALRAGTWKEQP